MTKAITPREVQAALAYYAISCAKPAPVGPDSSDAPADGRSRHVLQEIPLSTNPEKEQ